jgi:hypothetical protein
MDYVYPYKEKVGRPKSKPQEFIDSTEVVYETEEHMDSFEIDEEQVSREQFLETIKIDTDSDTVSAFKATTSQV